MPLWGRFSSVCVDSFKWNVSNINLKCSVVFLYCVKCVWKRHMAKVDSMTGLSQDLCESNWVCWDFSQGRSMEDQPLKAVPKGWGEKFFSSEEESERDVTTFLPVRRKIKPPGTHWDSFSAASHCCPWRQTPTLLMLLPGTRVGRREKAGWLLTCGTAADHLVGAPCTPPLFPAPTPGALPCSHPHLLWQHLLFKKIVIPSNFYLYGTYLSGFLILTFICDYLCVYVLRNLCLY